MNVIIMGPPGSGKSTQSKLLADKLNSLFLASGDVSRQIASEDTDEGNLARQAVATGGLTPDNILFHRTRKIIDQSDLSHGIVFDGYPRNKEQIFLFENMLAEKNLEVDKVVVIDLPDEIGISRMLTRAKIEGRVDDKPEVIKERFRVYHQLTQPIIRYYENRGKAFHIEGIGSIQEVSKLIFNAVNK